MTFKKKKQEHENERCRSSQVLQNRNYYTFHHFGIHFIFKLFFSVDSELQNFP